MPDSEKPLKDGQLGLRIPLDITAEFRRVAKAQRPPAEPADLLRDAVVAIIDSHTAYGSVPRPMKVVQQTHPSAQHAEESAAGYMTDPMARTSVDISADEFCGALTQQIDAHPIARNRWSRAYFLRALRRLLPAHLARLPEDIEASTIAKKKGTAKAGQPGTGAAVSRSKPLDEGRSPASA